MVRRASVKRQGDRKRKANFRTTEGHRERRGGEVRGEIEQESRETQG